MDWSRRGFLVGSFALCCSRLTHASQSFRVVAHPTIASRSVATGDLSRMFLKQTSRWPDGTAVRPVDLTVDSEVRRAFSEEVIGRTVAAVRSYWQQAIFSGRGVPPPELESDAAVIAYVLRTEGAIGYVSSGAATGAARILEVG
jgi:hypothetical protein